MPLSKSKLDAPAAGGGSNSASSSNRNSYNGSTAPPPAYADALPADGIVPTVADGKPPLPPDAPPVDLTAAFANLNLSNGPRDPDVDTCLAHLKLLAAFQNMKEEIGYADGLWGIWDTRADDPNSAVSQGDVTPQDLQNDGGMPNPNQHPPDNKMAVLSKLREKRWAVFVARAVDRYEAWWKSMYVPYLTERSMTAPNQPEYELFPTTPDALDWNRMVMPPLDVLMVFHSHLLNPRAFLEDSMRYGARSLWASGFPWRQVNQAIDSHFSLNMSDDGKAVWVAQTGCAWNNVDDALVKKLKCPACSADMAIPWTTCGLDEHPKSDMRPGLVGEGYGDGKLLFPCTTCEILITPDLLSVAKFVEDSKALLVRDTPMPGTLLNPRTGMPEVPTTTIQANLHGPTFPNRMIKKALRGRIVELIRPGANPPPDLETVRRMIETTLTDQTLLKQIDNVHTMARINSYRLTPVAKVCVRKMMSRYWGNFSIFALDLSGAVMRQGIFVGKMCNIDWLHSPSAGETMTRLLQKYTRFFTIMADHPLKVAVPTLDVDLAWHTHQLSPAAYYKYSTKRTAKFIDHDDKMDEGKLSESFEWTSKIYQEKYNEVYSECTCWYCEAIRASHVSSVGKLLGLSQQEKVSDNFHTSGAAQFCPPDNSAHISAHNAVKTDIHPDDAARKHVYDRMRAVHEQRMDENYAKACRRAEKKGRKLPPREQYYDHWGYSYYMYAPYYYPMFWAPGMYYGYYGPGYVPAGDGAWGNCCQGSCGNNGVAAGACGGPGGCGNLGGCGSSSGCGGASGGCGGGGGGGGGCGGGGGGGGGGCGGGGGG